MAYIILYTKYYIYRCISEDKTLRPTGHFSGVKHFAPLYGLIHILYSCSESDLFLHYRQIDAGSNHYH